MTDDDVRKERICSQMLKISESKGSAHQSGIVLTSHHCNYREVLLDSSSSISVRMKKIHTCRRWYTSAPDARRRAGRSSRSAFVLFRILLAVYSSPPIDLISGLFSLRGVRFASRLRFPFLSAFFLSGEIVRCSEFKVMNRY